MSEATVYRMYDADSQLLYVGCTIQWPKRLADHQSKPWWADVTRVELQHFDDHRDALTVEGHAQDAEAPIHNVIRNGRIPNLKARRRDLKRQRDEEDAQRDADLAARGMYSTWVTCSNCRTHINELPLGTARVDAICPRCGVLAHGRKAVA